MIASRLKMSVLGIGATKGEVHGIEIVEMPYSPDRVHTISMYLNRTSQQDFKELITEAHPSRIIFNPGSENPEMYPELEAKGIEVLEACTMTMLSTGQF